MSKSTALKAMTALATLKVVNMKDAEIEHNYTKQITLGKEFEWLFDKEFADLRQGFNPVDTSKYDSISSWTLFEELESQSQGLVDGDEFEASLIKKGFDHNGAVICIMELLRDKKIEDVGTIEIGKRIYRRYTAEDTS